MVGVGAVTIVTVFDACFEQFVARIVSVTVSVNEPATVVWTVTLAVFAPLVMDALPITVHRNELFGALFCVV